MNACVQTIMCVDALNVVDILLSLHSRLLLNTKKELLKSPTPGMLYTNNYLNYRMDKIMVNNFGIISKIINKFKKEGY